MNQPQPDVLYERGIELLVSGMGVAETLRFLSRLHGGSGNFTKERAEWPEETSVAALVDRLKKEFPPKDSVPDNS